jgi:hypothetical protein
MNPYDYMIQLAEKNICDGVLEEPRFYYDSVLMVDGNVQQGTPDVFRNGEQFPVRITHMTMAMRGYTSLAAVADERVIQDIGVRLRGHDTYYKNRQFTCAPLWHNTPVAAGDAYGRGCSSWRFERPFVLSARDALRVIAALESTPTGTSRRIGVGFSGLGMASRRPYFLAFDTELTAAAQTQFQTDTYRNDGGEPIVITEMSCWAAGLTNVANPIGDVRELRVNVNQVGNGTGAQWGVGPVNATPLPECPAVLLGPTSGRAIVHRFPGDGFIWEPGEGITLEVQRKAATVPANTQVGVAMLGYIVVK